MINFNALDLDYSYLQTKSSANSLNSFANALNTYFKSTQAKIAENITTKSTKYSERNIASNELARFFSALGFECQSEQESGAQSANSAIDLALLENGVVKVIIEAKLPESCTQNKQSFSPTNTNCKALHEAILYYLREVNDKQNYALESIIITDFSCFYIFNYKEFERIFTKNTKICDIFKRFKNDTSNFYAKARDVLDLLDDEICGFALDLERDLGKYNSKQDSRSTIQNLSKIFHKDFLFNDFQQTSPLNQRFYDEILYILGLEEHSVGGKIIIESSKESIEGQNTLYHLIDSHLAQIYGTKSDIDTIMQYIILWLNRILFLKLIEANLVRFNGDKSLAILRKDKIKNYQDLSNLFFEVLAKKPNERKDSPLDYLPYLNSSLFDRHECEEILDITMLDNNAEFFYYPTTQVKKDGKRQRGRVNLLSYIFEFLDAFDFGSGESSDETNIVEQKELIKTSVLGLVFEKLNGYKEGSFFTPNFITAFMCKESLEKVVVDKFNGANPSWSAKNLKDLAVLIRDERTRKDEFKAILRSVKICDPAVGSGHFLVSALCEMVRIYHALRLSDELNEYDLKIDDDEIIVYVENNKVFEYKKPTKPHDNNQTIQKSLFNLKKSIIENNLFGVDINPNSVEICKLRLWIELLKNSYYLRESAEGFDMNLDSRIHQMQTLPNIDINIKCGNSLISRFKLDDSLPTTQNIKMQIDEYKKLVFDYKNADQESVLKKMSKKDIESKIDNIKAAFRLTLKDPKTKGELEKAIKKHTALYGLYALDDKSLLDGLDCGISHSLTGTNLNETEKKEAFLSAATINYLRDKLDSALSGAEYKNAFEWRFEFPEVLSENGDFMGFDLVIGNPPYGNLNKKCQKHIIESKFPHSYFGEISSNFAELAHSLIKNKAHFSFVTSYALTFSLAQSGLRNLLQSNYKHIQISSYDRDGFPQFKKMSQSVSILFAYSKSAKQKAHFITSNFVRQKITHEELEFSPINDLLLIDSELGSEFAKKHRIPKIGGDANLQILRQMQKLPTKLGNLFSDNESLYIRTSGNYWYNAFLEIPYQSTEIKSFSVKNKYFVFCLINSNVYYWWLRIYGDGRHNNKDIMDSFRLPKIEIIEKHNDLWKKLALNHWDKMKSVFNAKNKFFATSKIKDCVDILDYHICLKVLGFNKKTLKYICDYDSNIRGGLKCNFRTLETELKK